MNVDFFFANFTITPVGAPSSIVSFRRYSGPDPGPPPVDHNGDHHFADAGYLFAGNSLNMSLGDHAGVIDGDGVNDTVFNGSDGRIDVDPLNEPGNLVTLDAAERLWFRFELFATGIATGTETRLAAQELNE